MNYVIVGNGIIGLTAAFRLSQRLSGNETVTIIGPEARTGSATLAAAAMLNSFAGIDAYSLKSDADLLHFEMSHRATHMWPAFEEELIAGAGDHLPRGCVKCQVLTGGCFDKGTYVVNNATADDLDDRNFDAIVQACEDLGEQYAFVNPSDIPNYRPAQKGRATRAIPIRNASARPTEAAPAAPIRFLSSWGRMSPTTIS